MESVILLILFTYPGAMADFIHNQLCKDTTHADETVDFLRTARDFFLSAVITAFSLWIFGSIRHIEPNLSIISDALQNMTELWIYLFISLACSALFAILWFLGQELLRHVRNRIRKEKDILMKEEKNWQSMLKDKNVPYEHSVMAIRKDGKLIRAGIPYIVPNNPEKDPWLGLEYTDFTETILKDESLMQKYQLSAPTLSYTNLETGTVIDLYHGEEVIQELTEWYNHVTSSAAEAEPSEAEEGEQK